MSRDPEHDSSKRAALQITVAPTERASGRTTMKMQVTERGGGKVASTPFELWFSTGSHQTALTANAIVPALLPMAMVKGADLLIDAPVTAGVLHAAERVQDVLEVWMPDWHRVELTAPATSTPSARGLDGMVADDHPRSGAVAAFFSGGVDSFYTLQMHRDSITHLIFVHGFDIPVTRNDLHAPALDAIRQVAAALNLELIEVRTNLRELTDRWVSWEMQHGAAMAAVAHLLAPGFERVLIPSSYAEAFLFPYGSHPGLDPLWSADGRQIVHDGCALSRFEKVCAIGGWDLVRQHLRVCWQNNPGAYNCGACQKCQWTMLYLQACGELESSERFPLPLDLAALIGFPVLLDENRYRLVQVLSALRRKANRDPALERTVEEMLARAKLAATPSLARDLRRDLRRVLRAGLNYLRIGHRR